MGVFAVIGLGLCLVAVAKGDGRLGLLGAVLFGVGVAGDQWMNLQRFNCK